MAILFTTMLGISKVADYSRELLLGSTELNVEYIAELAENFVNILLCGTFRKILDVDATEESFNSGLSINLFMSLQDI